MPPRHTLRVPDAIARDASAIVIALRDLRIEAGLVQKQVADATGMNPKVLSHRENALGNRLRVIELLALLQCYGADPVSFFARVNAIARELES